MQDKSINKWQNQFAAAMKKKYPKDFDDQEKRLSYIKQDVEDIAIALKVENSTLNVDKSHTKGNGHQYTNPDERIIGLLANVFALTQVRSTHLDEELQKALEWFCNPETKASSETKK